jgi:hypothetical protein
MQRVVVERNDLTRHLMSGGISLDAIFKAAVASNTVDEFVSKLRVDYPQDSTLKELLRTSRPAAEGDFREMKLGIENPEAAVRLQSDGTTRPVIRRRAVTEKTPHSSSEKVEQQIVDNEVRSTAKPRRSGSK